MKHVVKLLTLALITVAGSLIALEAPAFAHPYCDPIAKRPTFSGDTISGVYKVNCSQEVDKAKLTGRIKEKKNNLPDQVHDTESFNFTNDKKDTIETEDCNDGDDIYIEAQINSEEPPDQSASREMQC